MMILWFTNQCLLLLFGRKRQEVPSHAEVHFSSEYRVTVLLTVYWMFLSGTDRCILRLTLGL